MRGENFKTQKEYYDGYWLGRKNLCIDEKCRKNFIISSVKKIMSEFKHPLRILDLGCGRGWLTEILSGYGNVLGVDLAIDTAKQTYPHLKFKQANIIFNEIEEDYDLIVSSEVIEHLTSEHQQIYVKKAYGLLSKNGYLILTTPNKPKVERLVKELSIKQDELQPIENWLDKESLVSLLNPYFKIISLGSLMFYPILFRKYKLFNVPYGILYGREYRLFDRILKSSNYGLHLAIVAQKVR